MNSLLGNDWEGMMPNKTDIVLHLYKVANDLIDLIAIPSKENQKILLEKLGDAKKEYVGDDTWWNWVVTAFRKRGPELKRLISALEVEEDELLRLQAFKSFIEHGKWESTSANTTIFNEIINQVSPDFKDNDSETRHFVIKTLKKEMINTIDAKEAAFKRLMKERELEKRAIEVRAQEIARLKKGIVITDNESYAQKQATEEKNSVIYYVRKGAIYQFFWVDNHLNQHRLIHSGLKPFYSKEMLSKGSLSPEELNTLKSVVLECVCEIKESLSNEHDASDTGSIQSAVVDIEAPSSKEEFDTPVTKLVDKSFLEGLKKTLLVTHQIEAPSASSAEVKNIEPPKPSDIKLKYSPDFFATLESHFSKQKQKPRQAHSQDITTGPDGKMIGKIDKGATFFKTLEEHFGKDRKSPQALASTEVEGSSKDSTIAKIVIPEAVARSLGAKV